MNRRVAGEFCSYFSLYFFSPNKAMWKVLLMISAVVLIGSGVFSFMNKDAVKATREDRQQNQADVQKAQDEIEKKKEDLKQAQAEAEKLKAEAESLKTELAQAKLKESNGALQVTNLTMESEKAAEALKNAEEFLEKIPNIKKLKEEMAERSSQIQEAEIAIASTKGQVSAAEERRASLDATRAELQAIADDRNKGLIRGEFATTVKKAFNNWGFVVIAAGDNEGVVNKAQLDVLRRGQPICKLLVTAVEPAEAVAEVIPGSLQPGQSIQDGDVVTKSTTLIPELTPTAKPPAGGATAGGEGADPAGLLPPADGGGAAPMGAGGDPDPFAAPAAPAGGGMDGGAAEPDPFAPKPAAPADGGAMDGGATEPDPFAPKPDAPADGGAMDGGATPPADDPFAQ